ncbi:hypothetical protein [Desulfoferula mesophila]|uniref:YkgJ family cysteine cluster protein n=1 Tax=Desulfoferula mesophila TaxID=3058419 RepID=A0AAU9EIH6_9BACT|nr:hypothetical protein FAK_21100 [Desulfoferula mesophilus]
MGLPAQRPARELALRISQTLELPRRVFARHCPELCPDCARPCCARISRHGILDAADLILMAVLNPDGAPYPSARSEACPFLSPEGCELPWSARPYACLHYVCDALRRAMSPEEAQEVERALARAGELRSELVAAYTQGRGTP